MLKLLQFFDIKINNLSLKTGDIQFRILKRCLEGIKKDASQTANIFIDSGSQTRTDDNLINSQVLYQLSYAGITQRI